jgi:hypothetical protein
MAASSQPRGPRFRTAKDLFDAFPRAVDDMDARPSGQPSLEFAAALVEGPTPEDAITFCAYLLDRREAVWWGLQCVSAVPALLSDEDRRLLALAEDWVRQGGEEIRDAALSAGMAAKPKTPSAWVALAAGWSGETMQPLGAPPVIPAADLPAKAVNAAVLGLLARIELRQRPVALKGFVRMGLDLATAG